MILTRRFNCETCASSIHSCQHIQMEMKDVLSVAPRSQKDHISWRRTEIVAADFRVLHFPWSIAVKSWILIHETLPEPFNVSVTHWPICKLICYRSINYRVFHNSVPDWDFLISFRYAYRIPISCVQFVFLRLSRKQKDKMALKLNWTTYCKFVLNFRPCGRAKT